VARPAPLILANDAECLHCRAFVDWIQERDQWGLVIPFPLQNPELVRMAPELAGRALEQGLHGVDTETHDVAAGDALAPLIARRLPGWRWLAPLAGLLFFTRLRALGHAHAPARSR